MKDKETDIKPAFRKDFLWYLMSSVFPMAIGFIKTPIFTRHFSKEDFGQLGLVSITFSFLGMFLFSWIASCIWRFFNREETAGDSQSLYSNLFFLFLCAMVLLSLFTGGWLLTTENDMVKELVIYSSLQLMLNQLFLAYMVVVRLMKKSRFYMAIQSIRAVSGFLVALILVFYLDQGIAALVSSLVIIDAIVLTGLIVANPVHLRLRFKRVKKSILIEMLRYGSAGLILNISLLSISYMDRYIIAFFYDLDQVGIYDQVTKISQFSVLSLITVYFNTINPVLLKRLESDYDGSLKLINSYMFAFLFYGVPLIFYLSLFSKELSVMLLGVEFREGYILMPFIFWAALVYGISNFFELRMKFSNRIRKLGFIAVVTALSNFVMNVFLVREYGYQWAAYTTLITYLIMLSLLIYSDPKVLTPLFDKRRTFVEMALIFIFQYVIYLVVVSKMNLQIEVSLAIGLIFALTYLIYFRKTVSNIKLPMN